MEDQLIIVYIACFSALFTLIFGLLMSFLRTRAFEHRLSELEQHVIGLEGSVRGQVSNAKNVEKKERESAAMAELAILLQDPKADKGAIMKTMIGKYPDVALSMAKKMGIGL